MTFGAAVALCAAAYLGLLFAIAYWGDQRAARRGISDSGVVYALSIAVYCTSWTFYGSVGRAAERGIDFLPIYLGPTLVFCLGWLVLRKILHIAKANRITSIADLIASRYGKSALLAGLVTLIALVGSVPYIALQLKATSTTFGLLWSYPAPSAGRPHSLLADTAFWVAALMACFAILFGTRHIDASERHHGMVVAIAFESLVKLMAFAAVGVFVTFFLFDGFGDLFARAAQDPAFSRLAGLSGAEAGVNWVVLMLLAMAAIVCLPRQFQVTIVENLSERHLDRAMWLFPLYLLAINIFVIPIAWAGRLTLGTGADPDLYVLGLPLHADLTWLATVAFLGGLSAATSMVIVECVAIGTMTCNDLVLPILLRFRRFAQRSGVELVPTLLFIRRATIVILLALGYLYMRTVGDSYALVSIGLVSFAAVAQLAPAILFGLFWRRANRVGALLGIGGGTLIWLYTLLLPSFARSGLLPIELIDIGPWGIAWLKPYGLFGLTGLDTVTHSLFWSMLVNVGGIIAGSILANQSPMERAQAVAFVDADREGATLRRAAAPVAELEALLGRFIGRDRAARMFRAHAGRPGAVADPTLVQRAERVLAGAIGSSSGRLVVGSIAKEEPLARDDIFRLLDATSQALEYSRRLEEATTELTRANARLQEFDRLKDEFLSTVSHELRTPLTSIRSFSEILHDNPAIPEHQRREFLHIVIRESERLTRLINDLLDLAKIESGNMEWRMAPVDPGQVLRAAADATGQLFREKGVALKVGAPRTPARISADLDRLTQVMINLLSNAVKFCSPKMGRVELELIETGDAVLLRVSDNGPGVAPSHREAIFDRFRQVGDPVTGKPAGTGLGLAICRTILEQHGGTITVDGAPGGGARFTVRLPKLIAEAPVAAQ